MLLIDLSLFHQYALFDLSDTYTCSASGEWVSGGGKTEMPKCIAGMTLNVFVIFSHVSHFRIYE